MTRVRAMAGRHVGQVGETGETFSGGFLIEVTFDDGERERFRPYELFSIEHELPGTRAGMVGAVVEINDQGPRRVASSAVVWLSIDGEGRGHSVAEWLALDPPDYPAPSPAPVFLHLPPPPDVEPWWRLVGWWAADRAERTRLAAGRLLGRQDRS